MIKLCIDGLTYNIKQFNFLCGEVGVKVPSLSNNTVDDVIIMASITSSDDFMALLLTVDAAQRQYTYDYIGIQIGYLPYGRQDRVCVEGESLSIAVIMGILKNLNVDSIEFIDPHSSVTEALADPNWMSFVQGSVVAAGSGFIGYPGQVLVAPDEGAMKRLDTNCLYGYDGIVVGSKVRDLTNGNITHYSISGDVAGKECVVIDDICDGGATFILLGQALKAAGASKIILFVTHGVFTKGTKELTDLYDEVYTTNSYHMERVGLVDGVYYYDIFITDFV